MQRAQRAIMYAPRMPQSTHHHPAISFRCLRTQSTTRHPSSMFLLYVSDQSPSSPHPPLYIGVVPDPLLSITHHLSLSIALMASLLYQLSLVFLLFLVSSSFQIHARESRFFMKATRPEDPKEATPIPQETPAVKMEDPSTLPPLQSLSGSGYGLYGHGQEQFTPATTADSNNNNNKNYYYYNNARPNTELTRENNENKYNGGYNYASQFKYAYNGPSKFPNKEFNSGTYETKGYSNYVDANNRYGMSDTRYLDNGRYFYDVDAERNRNQYGTYPTRGNPEAGTRGGKYGNGVYGNGNAYEYSNTIGGYENNRVNQEKESQEDYVP